MIRRVTKIVSFIGIFIILISIYHQVFCFKYTDGIYQMKKFYEEEKDSIDIVFWAAAICFVMLAQVFYGRSMELLDMLYAEAGNRYGIVIII